MYFFITHLFIFYLYPIIVLIVFYVLHFFMFFKFYFILYILVDKGLSKVPRNKYWKNSFMTLYSILP